MKSEKLIKEINPLYLEDLKDVSRNSVFINEESYKILILRGIDVTVDGLAFISKSIVIDQDNELFYYDKEDDKLVESEIDYSALSKIIFPIYSKNQKIIDEYIKEIDSLEDSLFARKASRIFMDIWFDLKKDLSRIERYIIRNRSVLLEFYKANLKNEEFQETDFRDLLEQVNILQHNVSNQLSRLDALYNYHGSIKNDKLNKNIYTMTIFSAIFLPLNLIVGFFGINTENLFFSGNPSGTTYVLLIIVGALVLLVFGIPLIRFVDNHILRLFLGRYHVYKKLSQKVEKLENILKIE